MGRRDAVQVTLEVISRMRQIEPRLIVSYEPGWDRRGNGLGADYEGGIVHHTASLSSAARPFPTQAILRDGRAGLAGPLCNEAGPWCTLEAPRIHVMAAFPANHAGASGGRSMGPLPRTGLFNPKVRGLEIDYSGVSPMSDGQMHVALVWARANADVVGLGDIERIRAHMETSVIGKWDPGYASGRTIDMNTFRRTAAVIRSSPPEELMAMTKDVAEAFQRLQKAVDEIRWGVLDEKAGLRGMVARARAEIAAADANDAPDVLASAIIGALPKVGTGPSGGLTSSDVETAVRTVLGSLDPSKQG